jgi:hypothetical protein
VAVFCYGTVLHVVQLATGGWDPYPRLPGWLVAYFVSLTVLDPLAAALLWLRRRAGLALGCAVLDTDAAANGYASHVLDSSPGVTVGRIGQAAITVLALALLAAAPRVWLWLSPNIRSQYEERSTVTDRLAVLISCVSKHGGTCAISKAVRRVAWSTASSVMPNDRMAGRYGDIS